MNAPRPLRGLTSARGHHFLAGALDGDSVVVDLGAHQGEFSVELASRFGCRCYAVEANPALCNRMAEMSRVKVFNYAIAGENRPVSLRVDANLEASSLAGDAESGSDVLVTVRGMTLETYLRCHGIDSVDLLKVDIEGAEVDLFTSLSDEVLGRMGQITVEFHDFIESLNMANEVDAIKRRLASLGFACIVFSRSNNGDVLFVNRRRYTGSLARWLYLEWVSRYTQGIRRLLKRRISGKPTSPWRSRLGWPRAT